MMKMVPDTQVIQLLKEQFPNVPFNNQEQQSNMCSLFTALTDYAVFLLNNNVTDEFVRVANVVSDIHNQHKNCISYLIENIFVYKVGLHLDLHENREAFCELLPENLKHVLIGQHNSCAI